jgi:hypothetical protein
MCYFHVKQACQVKLRGKPMKEQKDILHDIGEMHLETSLLEYNDLCSVTYRKWCMQSSAVPLHTTLSSNGIQGQPKPNGWFFVAHQLLPLPTMH